jgi:hypothetical protein
VDVESADRGLELRVVVGIDVHGSPASDFKRARPFSML